MAETLATTSVIWGKYECTPDTQTYKYYTQSEWDVDDAGQATDGETITGYYAYGLSYDGSDQRYEYNENVSLTLTTLTAPEVGTVYNVHSHGLEVWYEKFYNNSEDGTVHLQRGRRYVTTHTGTRDVYHIGSKLGTVETENGTYPEYIYVATQDDYIIMTDGSTYYAFLEEGVIEEQVKSPGAYIGVATEFPVYETQGTTQVDVTSEALLEEYFTVNNGSNGFFWLSSENRFQNHNDSDESSVAIMKLTALKDTDISFDWGCDTSTDENYFYVYVNGVSVIYGEYDDSGSYSCSLRAGENIEFQFHFYAYDYSDDYAYFKNLRITVPNIVQIGTEIKGIARKVEKGYIGIPTEVPVYEEVIGDVKINAKNITNYFTVTNGSYFFSGSGQVFKSTNSGIDSSQAITTLTALIDTDVSFDYTYSSEANYDKFYLTVAGTTIEDGVSGETTTKTYSGSIKTGDQIVFQYNKDGSGHYYEDYCSFSNMNIIGPKKEQVGTEIKEVARHIYKAYIGIGGIARLCHWQNIISYWGALDPLDVSVQNAAGASIGQYALFAGGQLDRYDNSTTTAGLNVYNNCLTKVNNSHGIGCSKMTGISTNNHAIFGGGYSAGSGTRKVIAFDSSLTSLSPDYLDSNGPVSGTSCSGQLAIFHGMKKLQVYNSSLTKTAIDSMYYTNEAATSIDKYALFANSNGAVIVIDDSLTETVTSEALNQSRWGISATTIGNYALFAGGAIGDQYQSGCTASSTVDAYDSSLTKRSVANLVEARAYTGAASANSCAIFGGGQSNPYHYSRSFSTIAESYDRSLTHAILSPISSARTPAATSIGKYIIFAGGDNTNSTGSSDAVEAYIVG